MAIANRSLTRREFGRTPMIALLSVLGSASAYKGAAQTDSSSRRTVIRQRLPAAAFDGLLAKQEGKVILCTM